MTEKNNSSQGNNGYRESFSSCSINEKYISIELPVDMIIWRQAHKLLDSSGVYSNEFVTCIAQDPILTLEIIKGSQIDSEEISNQNLIQKAIQNLGGNKTKEILNEVILHPTFDDEGVQHLFDLLRHKSRRTSIVAKLLAEAIATKLSDNCQIIALFSTLDQMLMLANLGQQYIALTNEFANDKKQISEALIDRFKLNPEISRIIFLQTHGVTQDIIYTYDSKATSQNAEMTLLRDINAAANELVQYFDDDNWDALSPESEFPVNSALRQLKITPNQYAKIYSRLSTYLKATINLPSPKNFSSSSINIQNASKDIKSRVVLDENYSTPIAQGSNQTSSDDMLNDDTLSIDSENGTIDDGIPFQQIDIPKVELSDPDQPMKLYLLTKKGHQFIEEIDDMFSSMDNSEDLLTYLLEKLTVHGPFSRSALIVVSSNRKYAIVVAARGENIRTGQKLLLDDPLSPLAQCFSKVLSFGNRPSQNSPYGSKTYALAPINANFETPVALYADCGNKNGIPFESRRIFRTAVALLNQYLPSLKGSIPNELKGKKK